MVGSNVNLKLSNHKLNNSENSEQLKEHLSIFDKKLKSLANTIKDNYIRKYVLEYFLEKISELTPHTNRKNKNYFVKKAKSLETTKKHFKESNDDCIEDIDDWCYQMDIPEQEDRVTALFLKFLKEH